MSAVFTGVSEKLVSISVAIGASIKNLLLVGHFKEKVIFFSLKYVEIWCDELITHVDFSSITGLIQSFVFFLLTALISRC